MSFLLVNYDSNLNRLGTPLLDEWHKMRSPMRDRTMRQIGVNFVEAKQTLPATSTVNTTILKVASNGMVYVIDYY